MARALIAIALAVACSLGGMPHRAHAEPFSGVRATVTYTGSLGPVSIERPLCLCVYEDQDLQLNLGCYISPVNGGPFQISTSDTNDYYLVAFLDLEVNVNLDPGEPFEIYRNRTAPPADAVTAGVDPPTLDITFGDGSLKPCPGDCDGSGAVTVDELLVLVNIALGNAPLEMCGGADTDGSQAVEITEILAAVNAATFGCSE